MGGRSERTLPAHTNMGSPGPGGWYPTREPSWDQSSSATPSRYGLDCPPRVGTAQTLMFPLFEPFRWRPQKVINDPSGENLRLRSSGLAISGAWPRVKV